MRKILLLLALGVFDVAAFAQKAGDSSNAARSAAPPSGWTRWPFIIGVIVVVTAVVYLFWRNSGQKEGNNSRDSWGRGPRRSASGNSSPGSMRSGSGKRSSGFSQMAGTAPLGAVPMTAGVEKIQKTATPEEPETKLAQEVQPQESAAPVAPPAPKPEPPKPEIFYMTVPAADGSFPVGAKKMQPNGCLYQFEVQPGKPTEARICFAGSETDMGNAQAFRDLELLPACTFSNLPQGSGFRFEQTPGRALLDKGVWVVKEKIAIKFV